MKGTNAKIGRSYQVESFNSGHKVPVREVENIEKALESMLKQFELIEKIDNELEKRKQTSGKKSKFRERLEEAQRKRDQAQKEKEEDKTFEEFQASEFETASRVYNCLKELKEDQDFVVFKEQTERGLITCFGMIEKEPDFDDQLCDEWIHAEKLFEFPKHIRECLVFLRNYYERKEKEIK